VKCIADRRHYNLQENEKTHFIRCIPNNRGTGEHRMMNALFNGRLLDSLWRMQSSKEWEGCVTAQAPGCNDVDKFATAAT
jgi:hypothetical protein